MDELMDAIKLNQESVNRLPAVIELDPSGYKATICGATFCPDSSGLTLIPSGNREGS